MPTLKITDDDKAAMRSLDKINAKIDKLEGKLKQSGRAGKSAGDKTAAGFNKAGRSAQDAGKKTDAAFDKQKITSYVRTLTGVGGLLGAIKLIGRSYDVWLATMREISGESTKAINASLSLAALQEGGTKKAAVHAAARLASTYGISDWSQAFTTVQAMQSAPGRDLASGMQAAQVVFAATQAGVPLESGRELEVLGASQKRAPGMNLRMAYRAGQLSARDPKALARAGAAQLFWQDAAYGWGATAVLAGSVPEEQLQTYARQGGMALSDIGSAGKVWEGLRQTTGAPLATQAHKLQALSALGLTTPEKLGQAGFTEMRQQQALATLATNVEAVEKIAANIQRTATPGLFRRETGGIEAELPTVRLARQIAIVKAKRGEEMAYGPRAIEALRLEEESLIHGLALERRGRKSWLWMNYLDEQGRSAGAGRWLSEWGLDEPFTLTERRMSDARQAIRNELYQEGPSDPMGRRTGAPGGEQSTVDAVNQLRDVVERQQTPLGRPDDDR